MSLLDQITPVVITCNEEANIGHVLGRLGWAQDILVVDSGSTDRTVEVASSYPTVRIVTHEFTTFSSQWNHALSRVHTEWAMTLDADYVLTQQLVEELLTLEPTSDVAGYLCRFIYVSLGKPLRGSLYPPRTVLFRVQRAFFEERGHQQTLRLDGRVRHLAHPVLHDDRKPLSRWLKSQAAYADIEARRLLTTRPRELDWPDRVRLCGVLAAPLAVVYALLAKRCILDGIPGLYYAAQRGIAEGILALRMWELRSSDRPTASATTIR